MNCPNCQNVSGNGKLIVDWQKNTYEVCSHCECWFQNPPADVKYEEQYWGIVKDPDGNVRDLRTERSSRLRNWYCETVDFVNGQKPGRILDVGSGLGFFLSAVNDQWEKHALDVSQTGLDFIFKANPKIHLHHGILEEHTFQPNTFDVVMCYHVIEHVTDPHQLVNVINKILKPGGVAIFGTPNIQSIAARWFKGRFRLLGNGHLCLFHPKALRKVLFDNKLEVFRTVYPFFGTDYVQANSLLRFLDPNSLSPAFYGNVMNMYARKV